MAYPSEPNTPLPVEPPAPDFDKMPDGLLPAVVQDARTGKVLMLGYMNAAALEQTRSTGLVTFFSRSKQRLWTKGESSGHWLHMKAILLDCDRDALLIKAEPNGPVCHTGADTCWKEPNDLAGFLVELETIIRSRRVSAPEESYTARLFAAGTAKIAQKVGEEAVETVIEALGTDLDRLRNETADLLYHLLVLLVHKGISLAEIEQILLHRHQHPS